MVYYICSVFDINAVETSFRCLFRSIRDYFLLNLYTKSIHGSSLDGVGRIGSTCNSIQIIQLLGIVHIQAYQLVLHTPCLASQSVDSFIQVHLVVICVASLEIISFQFHSCDTSVCNSYLGSNIVVTELLHLCCAFLCEVQRWISGFLRICIIHLQISIRCITHSIYIHTQVHAVLFKSSLRNGERDRLRYHMISFSVCLRYLLCSHNICCYRITGRFCSLINLEIISIVCESSYCNTAQIGGNSRCSVLIEGQFAEFTRACHCCTVLFQVMCILQSQWYNISFIFLKRNSVDRNCVCCFCTENIFFCAEKICVCLFSCCENIFCFVSLCELIGHLYL